MRIVVFLGAPGSGKGTQAKRLSASEGFLHFSTGDMLRAAIQRKDPVGIDANRFISRGELVPDAVMIEIIDSSLVRVPSDSKILLDGFPRTLAQAKALDSNSRTQVSTAICFNVPNNVLLSRLTGRRICKKCGESYHTIFMPTKMSGVCDKCGSDLFQRPDDQEDVVKKRLEVFSSQNQILLDHYESTKRLTQLDGNQPVDRLQSELVRTLR